MQAVYVVIPDEGIRDALKTFLESFEIPARLFSSADELLDVIDGSAAGCVLVEAEITGLNGLGLLTQLRDRGIQIPLFLLVDIASKEFANRARQAGATGVFEKPLAKDELLLQLAPLFERQQLQ